MNRSQIASIIFILISFGLGILSEKVINQDEKEWLIIFSFILFLISIRILTNYKNNGKDN